MGVEDHGRYGGGSQEGVRLLIRWIREFMNDGHLNFIPFSLPSYKHSFSLVLTIQ